VAAALLAVLWPRRWEFTVNPHDVIGTYIESPEPVSIDDLHRELSFHMHSSYLDNREGSEKLVVFLEIANVLIALELVAWILDIAFVRSSL
jgi:hypothetical protein